MYVSSFSTFVHSSSTQKTYKEKETTPSKDTKNPFETVLNPKANTTPLKQQLPINYISDYKVLNNQQKLQNDQNKQELVKFTKVNAQNNAKTKYVENITTFSLFAKPKTTLNQTPKVSTKLSPEIQDISKQNLRNTMINTYTANEKYYQITSVA
jgi:hypothetical protein